jgi:hypothetical protein
MKKLTLAFALALSAVTAGAVLIAPAGAQPGWGGGGFDSLPDGSWRESCRYPAMRGSVLTAECRTSYDRWVRASINANVCRSGRIGNDDGRLVCEDRGARWAQGRGWDLPGGSWRQSCRFPVMRGSTLSAQCPDTNNRWLNAIIDVRSCPSQRFENGNGRLYCEGRGGGWGGGYGGALPGGSWHATCRAPEIRSGRFSADCRAADGYWRGSSIDMRVCRSNRVANRDGRLICEY